MLLDFTKNPSNRFIAIKSKYGNGRPVFDCSSPMCVYLVVTFVEGYSVAELWKILELFLMFKKLFDEHIKLVDELLEIGGHCLRSSKILLN